MCLYGKKYKKKGRCSIMEQTPVSSIQRRDFPRYATDKPIPITITTKKNPQNPIQAKGQTINISQQGLCVKLDTDIPVSERVGLQIYLHNSKNMLNMGRVVWSDPILSLYGIDLTEYKETIPADWFGYVAGLHSSEVERREKRERRNKQETKTINKNRKIEDRRTDKPIFVKCYKNKWVEFLNKQGNWFREYTTVGIPHAVIKENKKVISFSYCNYLGLNNDERVKNAMLDTIRKHGTCIASSRLGCGTTNFHVELEKKLAQLIGGEDCITYTLGYTANVGALAALAHKNDYLIIDESSHASLMDGCFLSKATIITYKHNDMKSLEKCLKNNHGSKLIVTDGIFSMDGDLVKLDEVYELAKKYKAAIYLDDAHGIGVVGKNGRGTAEHFGLEGKIDLVVGTLSKSLSSQGGYIVGKKKIIDYLKHTSRSFIFNVSLQHYFASGALKAIEIMETEPEHRLKLWQNVNYMAENLKQLGFNLKNSCTPIIPILIGDDIKTKEICQILSDKGIIVDAVFYPVVKRRESMLRIVINKDHSLEDLEKTINVFRSIKRNLGL